MKKPSTDQNDQNMTKYWSGLERQEADKECIHTTDSRFQRGIYDAGGLRDWKRGETRMCIVYTLFFNSTMKLR